jgi:hypothetical protein
MQELVMSINLAQVIRLEIPPLLAAFWKGYTLAKTSGVIRKNSRLAKVFT